MATFLRQPASDHATLLHPAVLEPTSYYVRFILRHILKTEVQYKVPSILKIDLPHCNKVLSDKISGRQIFMVRLHTDIVFTISTKYNE